MRMSDHMFRSKKESSSTVPRKELVTIANDPLTLEGVLSLVNETGHPGLVLCHPHPLFGGSMEDSRLRAISSAAVSKGFNTLRFNFRGVGKSEGSFGQGIGEIQDTLAAVRYLRQHSHTDNSRIALLGYSFGGAIALAAAMDADPAALVIISAPLRIPDTDPTLVKETLRYVRCPTYILHGKDDDVILPIEAEGIYALLSVSDKYLRLIGGANHFWSRRLDQIIPMILAFLTDKLRPIQTD